MSVVDRRCTTPVEWSRLGENLKGLTDTASPLPQRFELVKTLGEGGVGIVYAAKDRERDEIVAVKTLQQHGADALFAMKQEFRLLADIEHPNLVSLHEMVIERGSAFFSMEYVKGPDFLTYVRDEKATATKWVFDEGRLRRALPQLAQGIYALHAAGVVHRDLKPSNILLHGDVVKVLDFGLATPLDAQDDGHGEAGLVGSTGYMPPEQTTRGQVTPASDWYSFGVVLFQALTGRLPFEGSPREVVRQKNEIPAPPPRQFYEGVPRDLDHLCEALLARDPQDRPMGEEVLRRLGVDMSQAGGLTSHQVSTSSNRLFAYFAGRERELGHLLEQFEEHRLTGGTVASLTVGASGLGKSALSREFLLQLSRNHSDLVVLDGRCYERETVPYKAMDSVIDALSREWRALRSTEAAQLLPNHAELLPMLFPVLRRVPAVAERAKPLRRDEDPQVRRQRAFTALRDVFIELGTMRKLVIHIDDMQWVDWDSVNLLIELFRPPAPPHAMLLLNTREAPAAHTPLGRLVKHLERSFRITPLSPLAYDDSLKLARRLLGESSPFAEMVAKESHGNPYFLGEITHFLQGRDTVEVTELSLDDIIRARLERLSGRARRILELICVNGQPTTTTLLTAASDLDEAEVKALVRSLRSQNLVQRAQQGSQSGVMAFHSRIRASVLGNVASIADAHRRLALALEVTGTASHETLALHWAGANDPDRTATHARAAAEDALAAVDFERAAGLFKMALDARSWSGDEAKRLWLEYAESLSRAGRPHDAAQAFQEAARLAPEAEKKFLQLRVVDALLAHDYLGTAGSQARDFAASVGMPFPKNELTASLRLIWYRFTSTIRHVDWEEVPQPLDPNVAFRMDAAWTLASGLGVIDPVRSFVFIHRYAREAAASGSPFHVARALAAIGTIAATEGREKAAAMFLDRSAGAAAADGGPASLAVLTIAQGTSAYFGRNDWREARERFTRGFSLLREAGMGRAWERDVGVLFSLFSEWYGGDLVDISERANTELREAVRSGNRFLDVSLRVGLSVRHLIEDRPDEAHRDVVEALADWIPVDHEFLSQHFYGLWRNVETDLYQGKAAVAQQRIDSMSSVIKRSLIRHVALTRAEYEHLAARVALASGSQSTSANDRDKHARLAQSYATEMARSRSPLGRALSPLIRAGSAHLWGDRQASVDELRLAVKTLEAIETPLYAQAARFQLGRTLQGHGGTELVREATRWFTSQGVVNPEAMVRMLAPGFEEL